MRSFLQTGFIINLAQGLLLGINHIKISSLTIWIMGQNVLPAILLMTQNSKKFLLH